MCLCQWNTTPRASTIPWAKSLEHEKGQVCSMPWWIGPRGHLEPRLFFRRGDIVYERKWAEAKKPIHRFLDRVPLQMSSRRRRNASFWRPEIVLVVSLRKRVNAGKFRTRSQTGHNLLVPDDLSPSDFSSISESFILLEILIHWCVTKIGRNDQKKEYHIILYNRLPSIYKILEFFGNARMMDR